MAALPGRDCSHLVTRWYCILVSLLVTQASSGDEGIPNSCPAPSGFEEDLFGVEVLETPYADRRARL